MKTNLSALTRFSTALLLTLVPACGSQSSGDDHGDGGAAAGGSPASGTPGSGGMSAASGGATASGGSAGSGVTPGSGGTAPGAAGSSTGRGGMSATAGGSSAAGNGGTSAAAGGAGGAGGGAGSASSGAGAAAGGSGNGGASAGSGGGTTANFTVNVALSTAIPTVGIATWSLATPLDGATVHFGRDQSNLEFQAPVDLTKDDHRTLLLGMKQNTTYYVQVTATGGGRTYTSQVASVTTGALPSGVPTQTVADMNASALYAGGGFTVTCVGYGGIGGGFGGGAPGGGASTSASYAFIFDGDGDVVWAYDLSQTTASTCTSAHMSIDGNYMWAGNFGNTTSDGALTRISMDGLGTPDEYSLPGRSHDFAILPNDHVVYFARDDMGADQSPESIFELDPATSMSTEIYSENTDFGDLFAAGTGSSTGGMTNQGGHTNQINYVPELNAVSFSMYFIDTIALISYPDGKLLAAFGGDHSTFPNMSWDGEHGHDVYADHIDVFNNNGSNGGASVLRFQYDLSSMTATEEPDYSSGHTCPALGDVKEQPNGNYFVTYSTSNLMQELDPSLNLLREIDSTGAIGYTEHRGSMYGKPPPFNR